MYFLFFRNGRKSVLFMGSGIILKVLGVCFLIKLWMKIIEFYVYVYDVLDNVFDFVCENFE